MRVQTATGQGLTVESLVKTYPGTPIAAPAVNNLSFEIQEGAFFTLLGPSGCGKTTTLRCVAGLERHESGTIRVGATVVSSDAPKIFVPTSRRDIGVVFQSYAIWPHMSVFDNVAFPLRVSGVKLSKRQVADRVDEALQVVQLGEFGGRMATQMSGGQQQRLALARALVRRPKVLLLDEPLSNLDAKLREDMRVELRAIQRRLNITTLYITHDQAEALSMSNRVAVMARGRIEQEGPPKDIYLHPLTRYVAEFVGKTNFLSGDVVGRGRDGDVVSTPAGRLHVSTPPTGMSLGERVSISIRPESIALHVKSPGGEGNIVEGVVETRQFIGEVLDCRIRIADGHLDVRAAPDLEVRRGDRVWLELPMKYCTMHTDKYGQSIDATTVTSRSDADDDPLRLASKANRSEAAS